MRSLMRFPFAASALLMLWGAVFAKEAVPQEQAPSKEAQAAPAAEPADAAAADARATLPEWQVKREEQFAFAQAPQIERAGDRVTIRFETQGFCDVAIAIEDLDGKIVRHLVCGVLGENAPAPLQAGTKQQAVVWDGKDDEGKYLDDKDALSVRVSLGLKPRFERSLLWEPRRRLAHGTSYGADSFPAPLLACAPEGVYVDDGGGTALDHVRLFDHEGNYVRTVYPFPAEKIKEMRDLPWHTYPQDARKLPVKGTFMQNTMLTSGDSWAPTYNPEKQVFHTNGQKEIAHFGMHGSAATTMAVAANRVALAHRRLNRFATDGGSGGMALNGPAVSVTTHLPMTYAGPAGNFSVSPRSAALSPDGKWLYLAGYIFHKNLVFNGKHGVMRVAMDGGDPEVWLGEMEKPGDDAAHFNYPLSVTCDAKGHVYVADYMNDRVQVFAADGKLLRSVAASKPAHVSVHHATGELYVCSWQITNAELKKLAGSLEQRQQKLVIPATLNIFDAGAPRPKTSYALPFEGYNGTASSYYGTYDGLQFRVALDSWTEPPTIWMVPNTPERLGKEAWSKAALRLLVPKDGKLVVKRDFAQQAEQYRPVGDGRQRLFFNPATGKLYADPDGRHFSHLIEIDPATGKTGRLDLPVTCEDMAFDRNGHAYLKTCTELVRYNPATWQEVPFDYGDEREIEQGYKKKAFLGCLVLPAVTNFHHGGLWVSPKGRIAIGCLYEAPVKKRAEEKATVAVAGRPYTPRLFPGRTTSYNYGATYVHVWDKRGQVLYDDAVPGLGGTLGVGIDGGDNLYVLAASTRAIAGKPYFNDAAGTLMKFRPKQGRILCLRNTPVPLEGDARPARTPDVGVIPGPGWVEGAEWMYGGVGIDGKKWVGCSCWGARFTLDGYARVFAPEIDRYAVAVLDTHGNLILRLGRYGNADDGMPLVAEGGPPNPRALGGDEVALMNGAYLATDSDRRLFIADPGNGRISGVKLGYETEARVALKDVKDAED